ncbi:MAG: sporulation protein YtfJ [Clostridia bacterium]|jgi:sporulation protein YtfJ|nr:sporulation protein YtfJ [Clostridia bacterium]
MANENKLQDIIQTSLESLRTLVDSNTVIGNPINTESGTTIIPISKISMGFASGGLDYNGKSAGTKQNFGGGGGTGLSISPVGFLTVKADGSVEIVNINAPVGTVEQVADVIERAPEIVAKFKALFTKNKKDKAAKAENATEAAGETMEINIDAE